MVQQIMMTDAAVVHSQLDELDPRFVVCHQYDKMYDPDHAAKVTISSHRYPGRNKKRGGLTWAKVYPVSIPEGGRGRGRGRRRGTASHGIG